MALPAGALFKHALAAEREDHATVHTVSVANVVQAPGLERTDRVIQNGLALCGTRVNP